MEIFLMIVLLVACYLLGSVPFGLLIVKLTTGKDIRDVASGRTGGTNAMRAAGYGAGIATALLDLLKTAAAAWVAKALFPLGANLSYAWLHVFAPIASIIGHNYSIFLLKREEDGRLHFHGGAGGAPCVGGAFGLWAPSIFIILPVGAIFLFGIGYASIATMSVALLAAIVFAVRAWLGLSPWQYILYGVLAEVLLLWALRPNIQRLLNGTERRISMGRKAE